MPNERTVVSSSPTFTPQLIGQTEKTLNAILARRLAGAGLTEPQWVTLTLAARNDGPVDRDRFAAQVADVARFGLTDVQSRISELAVILRGRWPCASVTPCCTGM